MTSSPEGTSGSSFMKSAIQWLMTPWLVPGRPLTGLRLQLSQSLAVALFTGSVLMFLIALPVHRAQLIQNASQMPEFAAALPLAQQITLSRILSIFPAAAVGIEVGIILLYSLASVILFYFGARDWRAILMIAGMCPFVLLNIPTLTTMMEMNPYYMPIGSFFKIIGMGMALLFFYIFPSGQYSPPWMRLLLWGWVVWGILWLVFPDSIFSFTNPHTMPFPQFYLAMGWWSTGIGAQIYRYFHVSTLIEKQQGKWVTFGAILMVLFYGTFMPLRAYIQTLPGWKLESSLLEMWGPYILLIFMCVLPITFGFAVLRYRLWDIDLIICKTMEYGLLTGLLGAGYLLGVVVFQSFLTRESELLKSAVTSGNQFSAIIIVFTTLAGAALFNPLRRWVQDFIDRRFYQRKYDAEKALAEFAAAARQETDPGQLSERLVRTLQETLQPEHVSIWLSSTCIPRLKNKHLAQSVEPGEQRP